MVCKGVEGWRHFHVVRLALASAYFCTFMVVFESEKINGWGAMVDDD